MYTKAQARQRTRNSFFISLLLHMIAFGVININLPRWYHPPPTAEPIVMEPIEIVDIRRFHVTRAEKKQISAPKSQAQRLENISQAPVEMVQRVPAKIKPKLPSEPISHIQPLPALTVEALGTDVSLPLSNSPLSEHVSDEAQFNDSVESPQPLEVEIKYELSTEAEQTEQIAQNEIPNGEQVSEGEPLSREAQIGNALGAIAESIADGASSSAVDIVFLLDASGSMEDNIRAVGNHLTGMVETFQEKQVDFTMGVATFKYNALIFPQTRDYQKYERLLANVKCGGDERAYDAIVKSIARVKFRSGVERRFILVTDEPCKGSYTILEVLKRCREAKIKIDVIGINDTLQKALAVQTGGLWFPIPGG
ncbi:VWA domain-containing protein [Candidatus Poribacteria bacterium]|nr:VWA domain-containing protein [Candidatus Poribacteria bacterium]